MRLLVVDDEQKTASYLAKGLGEKGFAVDVASNGRDAMARAGAAAYDAIVLDVMMPGLDGWGVMAELRRAGVTTQVMFLTARDTVPDRVKGLDLGADDYLVKPFAFSELVARLRTITRRGSAGSPDTLRVADVEIDLVRRRCTRAGRRIDLTAKEFALLALLARRAGEVLSRAVLAEQVWDMSFDGGSNVVDVHVRRLRAKVDDPFDKKLIHTARGLGYVLEDR